MTEDEHPAGTTGPDRNERPPARARWVTPIAWLVIAWTLPAATNVLMDLAVGTGDNTGSLAARIFASALPWYVWAPFTPFVVRLVRRRPLMRPITAAKVAAHLSLYALATVVFVVALRVARLATGLPLDQGGLIESALSWSPFTLLAYAAVAGIAHATLYAKRARDEAVGRALLAEQLVRAQLDALRMQLHPHFLFNALNTVSMLVRDRDADSAVKMIAELGSILRELLRASPARLVPLHEELDLIRRYLSIEQVRFGERLAVDWHVEPDALDALVPPFILQPLVENAIRHGIARITGAGLLRIEACTRADTLVLTIHDNGPGRRLVDTDPESAPGGLGLANTRARLEYMYGDAAYIRLARTEEQITLATVAIPLERRQGEARAVNGTAPAVRECGESDVREPAAPPAHAAGRA